MSTLPLFMALSASLAAGVIWLRLKWPDVGVAVPGERSLHARSVAHGGGLGIVASALVIGLLARAPSVWLLCVAVLALISAIDDWRPLPPLCRLAVHLCAASAVVFLHGNIAPVHAWFALLLIGWAINAYNFMDGADGLAGSMAAVGFAAYALVLWHAGDKPLLLLCASISVAALAFLIFNWHPARIFMGDVGSIPLGFLAGTVGWYGVVASIWEAWFPLMVFLPFLGDSTATLLRRAWNGKKLWQAHREHYYQRMVMLGMDHGAMCRRWLAFMIPGAAIAVIVHVFAAAAGWMALIAWMVVLAGLGHMVDRNWKTSN